MKGWLFQHMQVMRLTLNRLRASPIASLLSILVIGIALFYVWQRPSRRGDAPEYKLPDDPHEVLRGRLARGAITPQQYEELKALLDRDR